MYAIRNCNAGTWLRVALALMACVLCRYCAAIESAPANQTAGDSIYQLQLRMTDQDDRNFLLADKRGKPVIVSMFYNSCQFVCPMLIDTIAETLQSLAPEEREQVTVLLVTFDPARDDVDVLKHITRQRAIDTRVWTLARCDSSSVRKLAALLGIQYRRLPNGDFNHSTSLILLDREGRIAGTSNKLGSVDHDFVKLIAQVAKKKM